MTQTTSDYSLRYYGDPVLHQVCEVITPETLPTDLIVAMLGQFENRKNRMGLAAPQVGSPLRAIVAKIATIPIFMMNPEIIAQSPSCTIAEEKCLSLPGYARMIERPISVVLHYWDIGFTGRMLPLDGIEARCVLHEIDHLDGKLICDGEPQDLLDDIEQLAIYKQAQAMESRSGSSPSSPSGPHSPQ